MPTSSRTPEPPTELPDAVADFKIRQWTRERRVVEVAAATSARQLDTLGRLLAADEMPAAARRAIGRRIGRHLNTQATARKHLATLPQRLGGAA